MRFTHSYAAAAVIFFLKAVPVSEARTSRAKRWVPSDPKAFEVQLGFDPVGRYVTTIGMGSPFAQAGNFSFLLSTCAPYTGVAAAGCESCAAQIGQAPLYNVSRSSSAVSRGTAQTSFSMGSGSMSGAVISEDCGFRKLRGAGWVANNETIVLIQKTEGILGKNVSGLVGFGRSTGNDSYVSGILNSRGWQNATFAFAFNEFNVSDTTQSAGSLNVREVNPDLFTGDIHWQPLPRITDLPKTMPSDWSISFDSYKMSFGSHTTDGSGGVAIIDPYFQEVRIPNKEAMDFFNNISNAKMTIDSTSLSWDVPCDQEFTLSITIGGAAYQMKSRQLTSSTGTVCTSLVKAWADPAIRTYLLGAPFVTTAYIVYNAQQDQTGDQIGVAPRAGNTVIIINQGVPAAVLIAAIVGSVCGVGLIATVALFVLYRRRQDSHTPKTRTKTPDDKSKIEPFTPQSPPNSSTPMLSSSMKQTGYILEQGPIGGEPGGELGGEPSEGNDLSPLSVESREPIRPPDLSHVRQSQTTEASVLSPEFSRHQEFGARPAPARSGVLPHSYHSFYGAHVAGATIVPEPVSWRPPSPGTPASVSPPPPYPRPQASSRAVRSLPTPPSPVREKH